MQGFGILLCSSNAAVGIPWILHAFVTCAARIPTEEAMLLLQHGETYRLYAERVPRLIPFFA